MNRRNFLSAAIAGATASMMPNAFAAAASFAGGARGTPGTAFDLTLTPLRGYHGQDVACDSAFIEGKIPAALNGMFYRNGPGLFERGGQRYEHWFDGDGLVQAWKFDAGKVSHRARFVRTQKFIAESEANEFLVPAFGSSIKAKIPVRSADTVNTANTNVIRMGDRLFAMWEGGSPYALDPNTLATTGIVTLAPELKSMPFSAHPKVEADGTVWNFGTMMGKVALYQLSPRGDLIKHAVFDAPVGALAHDFAISQNHLILMLPPISLDRDLLRAGKGMAQAMVWNAKESVKIIVIDKADFSKRQTFELPAFMVFHFGNAWEDKSGAIHVDFVQSDTMAGMTEWMPKIMRGERAPSLPSCAAFLTIDRVSKKLSITKRGENLEFPRIDPRFVGLRNRFVYYPVASGRADDYGLNGIMRLDTDTGKVDQYSFGSSATLEEHIVVPKPGSTREGEGWLIGVGFDVARQQTFGTVFDALNLAAGPIAIARLPYWTPTGFHGNFKAA